MQVNINDSLYQQISDCAAHMHMKIDKLIETEMAKFVKKKSPNPTLTFTPHPSWPKGFFDPYPEEEGEFPDVEELRAGLIPQRPVEL